MSTEDEPGRPGNSRGPTRRAVLLTGLSAAAAATAMGTGILQGLSGRPVTDASRTQVGQPGGHRHVIARPFPRTWERVVRVEKVHSRARGRQVQLMLVLPTRTPPAGMPMSLLLHGLGGSARGAAPIGLGARLSAEIKGGKVPPFGFIAVDGGNTYWHEHHRGDDPMAMLLDEVPKWLKQRGLGGTSGTPFACSGTSMGGFGALLYARRRAERGIPLAAVAGISPALMTSWEQARKRKAFHNEADWKSLDPLRHIGKTGGAHIAVWCGKSDGFVVGVRRFIDRAHPEIGYIGPGGHNEKFFSGRVPSLVSFLGDHTG